MNIRWCYVPWSHGNKTVCVFKTWVQQSCFALWIQTSNESIFGVASPQLTHNHFSAIQWKCKYTLIKVKIAVLAWLRHSWSQRVKNVLSPLFEMPTFNHTDPSPRCNLFRQLKTMPRIICQGFVQVWQWYLRDVCVINFNPQWSNLCKFLRSGAQSEDIYSRCKCQTRGD